MAGVSIVLIPLVLLLPELSITSDITGELLGGAVGGMFTLIGGAIAYTAALKQVDVQKLDAQFARNATSINNVFELSHTLRVAAIKNSSFYEILSKHHQDFHQDILEEYDSDLEKIHTELKFRMLPQCVNSILLITRKAISNT